jgi:oxidoreductase
MQVSVLAKSIRIAGELGTTALPPAAQAVQEGEAAARWTAIYNRGAVRLAEAESQS